MNKAYELKITRVSDTDEIKGSVNNVGYWIGEKVSWKDPLHNIVKLDIASEPDMIEIQNAKLYRYPKLSLPRVKVETLKEKYDVKVVRDSNKADYSIVSNKMIEDLLTVSWRSYYNKDAVGLLIKCLDVFQDTNMYSKQFYDNITSFYNKIEDNDKVDISLNLGWNIDNTDMETLHDAWNKAMKEYDKQIVRTYHSDVILENENVSAFQSLQKEKLVLDKCINRICNEDAHVITADEVITTMQMIQSGDETSRSLAVEMLANCNIEECFDKVAYMWTFGYDKIRYASNWNTVNVKALKDRMQDVTPQANQVYQIHMYEYLIRALIKEQSFTQWAWTQLRLDVHKNVIASYGLTNKNADHDNVMNIELVNIELTDKYSSCLVKEESGKEILDEITQTDGFDDLPF